MSAELVLSPGPLDAAAQRAVRSALEHSRRTQDAAGYWAARLESNACMEAQWILALHVMGRPEHPLRARMGKALLREQRSDGSWEVFKDAPAGDINTTVECYAALRSLGYSPDSEPLDKARSWIQSRGGLSKIRVFTRYWLALIGVWSWDQTPNLPPEIVHCPRWLVFNIYNFASWARATLMPLAVLSARRLVVPLPGNDTLEELFPEGRSVFDDSLPRPQKRLSWEGFFVGLDRVLHWVQDRRWTPFRKVAIERILEWIVRHQDADGVWGGIQPPWIYSLMALWASGYSLKHPVMEKGLGALNDRRWRIDIEDSTYIAASVSPVWDTSLTLLAIADADAQTEFEPEARRAVHWLLEQEVRYAGDWAVKQPGLEPGGWAFEYENLHYPDIDDTAVTVIVLTRLKEHLFVSTPESTLEVEAALQRAERWMLGMQCDGGGWAAFDRDNNRQFLTKIPFCDFGEVLDPPSVDVTSHALEAFALRGYDKSHPAIHAALEYLKEEQEPDGSWFGRWGVNYVYGTSAVLPALEAVGEDMSAPWIQKAADWVLSCQNEDGGWGESCSSYMDENFRGRGPSTASQTAWALMALAAVGRSPDTEAVRKAVRWLTGNQRAGTWDEVYFTGTGFPGYGVGQHVKLGTPGLEEQLAQGVELSRAFMIRYHMYQHYFPIMALARARKVFAL